MEKVRGGLKKIRCRFEEKIDTIPLCFKPRTDPPSLIYTVIENRECESLLCQSYSNSDVVRDQANRDQRSDVNVWKEDEASVYGSPNSAEEAWNVRFVEKEVPTIRLATFDVAFFSLAPAIPPEHPAASAHVVTDDFEQPTWLYHSSDSSILSSKSKSSCSEASSGFTIISNSRESNDTAETCAIVSHKSKPPQTFDVPHACCLLESSKWPCVKATTLDIRKAWRTSASAARNRAICNFKSRGGRCTVNGTFYHSKLNPVFSFNNNSHTSPMYSLPRLLREVSYMYRHRAGGPPAWEKCGFEDCASPCFTPLGSPVRNMPNSPASSPTTFLLSGEALSSDFFSETTKFSLPDPVMLQRNSSFPYLSSPNDLSTSSVSPQNPVSVYNSAISSMAESPASDNVSSLDDCTNDEHVKCPGLNPSLKHQSLSILEILLEIDADIIALQEVRAEQERGMKPLSELAEALGMEYAYAESWAPDFGNAVLSRWPIKSASVQQIHDETDYRNVLKVVVSVPLAGDLHFYCTQLDHLNEDWRMKQIDSLMSMLPPNQPHILTGNLNSLSKGDYSKARWNEISEWRKNNNKGAPKGDVMRRLFQEKLYKDAKTFASQKKSAAHLNPSKDETQGTCQYGTRVDYILGSQKLPFDFIPGSYSVVSSKGTSNHDIVMVDLQAHCHL